MHRPDQILNDLIATCFDSAEGFGKAAKGAHSDELRQRLTDIERTRLDFTDQLAEIARNLGFEPQTHGHMGEILHKGWVDLETRIRPVTDHHLLEACRAGEQDTAKHYEAALARPELPERARSIVEQQLDRIRQDLSSLAGATSSAGGTSV